jgi:hypothetical protein
MANQGPDLTTIVVIVGMVLGALVILSICWVWIRKQEIAFPALGGVLIGALLVTASVWAHVEIQISEKGIGVQLDALQKEITEVRLANQELTQTTLQLTDATRENATVLRDLSRSPALRGPGAFDAAAAGRRLDLQIERVEGLKRELGRRAPAPAPPPPRP